MDNRGCKGCVASITLRAHDQRENVYCNLKKRGLEIRQSPVLQVMASWDLGRKYFKLKSLLHLSAIHHQALLEKGAKEGGRSSLKVLEPAFFVRAACFSAYQFKGYWVLADFLLLSGCPPL